MFQSTDVDFARPEAPSSPFAAPPPSDGPRERLASLGAGALTSAELLAVLLGSGSASRSVFDLARELSESGLLALAQTSAISLARRPGLGLAKALRILAAFELGRRLHCEDGPSKPRLDSPELVAAYLAPRHAAHAGEVFGILALDSKHRLLGEKIVATGGRHSVAVTPADVFQAALPWRPRSVVAFHNHPSGDPHPSEEDKALTYRLARSGEVLGIALVDHIVIGGRSFASFKQLGLL
ncbi:MAG TPA: DNA repair protein RadC [Vicinamibacteria bacterium]|nr:DNA repair protein RadC [Vicinamibacteria bacterium]HRB11921.1 DNA repair protein RadC [Vicinamibacteria bacterium]